MGKIRLLSPSVYNKIAAGEVVENPAAAVKELVENSIDAGANKIVIEIQNGGMKYISVSDNGSGMDSEDIAVALVKHATSKVYAADDLFDIQTLGFRGEALASIAAVSHITLTTKTKSDEMGTKIVAEDGEIVSTTYVSANVGTTVEVNDLFYNTPARKKFLKTPSREAAEVTKYVAKLILTNPYLDVRYLSDGVEIYRSNGADLESAIFCVYGGDCLKNCLSVNAEYRDLRIKGYVGSPEYTKPNSTHQTLSVNGRCVVDKTVSAAVTQAFRPYLMTRQYPFYVLNIDVPFGEVDVNVHPKKTEVRFEDTHKIFNGVYVALKRTLEGYASAKVDSIIGQNQPIPPYVADVPPAKAYETPQQPEPELKSTPQISDGVMVIGDDYFKDFEAFKNAEYMNPGELETVQAVEKSTEKAEKILDFNEFAQYMEDNVTVEKSRQRMGMNGEDEAQQLAARVEPYKPRNRFAQSSLFDESYDSDDVETIVSRTRILGSAFKTYLMLELDDKLIFVDQHAAHERILFDSFMNKKSLLHDIQPMLFPYVFSVRGAEEEFIENNMENIKNAGIIIEPFGAHTYRISAVAMLFADIELKRFVDYILGSVDEFRLDDRKLVVEKIAQKACKAAVKAGYTLNEMEIEYILKHVVEGKALQCPHGRPTTVVFSKTDIEKMFKRIV